MKLFRTLAFAVLAFATMARAALATPASDSPYFRGEFLVDASGNHTAISGNPAHFTCDSGCTGGTGGDASAANQTTQITAAGAPADATCGTDTGSCDTIQLLKRNNQRLTSAIAALASVGPSTYGASSALASSKVLKASAATGFTLDVVADSTLSAATWYVLVFDATSLPANGAVTPAKCYQVPAGVTTFTAGWPAGGVALLTGETVGVSTTGCFTLTASAHAFISGDFQ